MEALGVGEASLRKDAGPRMIMDNVLAVPRLQMDMEEEKLVLDQALLEKIAEVLAILLNLEA